MSIQQIARRGLIGAVSGDTYAVARALLDNSATEYIDDTITTLRRGAFTGCTNLVTIKCHNVTEIIAYSTSVPGGPFVGCGVSAVAFPKLTVGTGYRLFEGSSNLAVIDLGETFTSVPAVCFFNSGKLATIILRSTTLCTLGDTNAFNLTKFASGGAGGTIYIPKALYDHLGDGTANDYKAATNWSTVDGYGTITWAQIEGSIYETQYADGTTIPTT